MYPFSELCKFEDYPFCYLLGVLKKWPPAKYLSAEFFTDQFSSLLTAEQQAVTPWQTRRRSALTRKFVLPSAPLTMAPSWSPFPLAFQALARPINHGKSKDSAFAIFTPDQTIHAVRTFGFGNSSFTVNDYAGDHCLPLENIHAQHFLWLLNMTVARATELKRPILLAGMPGFGYMNELERDINGECKLRLLKAGYLYPSHVPQGARFAYLTDPAARADRAAKLAQSKPMGIPPAPGNN